MRSNRKRILNLIALLSTFSIGIYGAFAQTAGEERFLPSAFTESDLYALRNGETVARILPTDIQREVAVCGLVPLKAPADMFLDSFRKNLVRKSSSAILEIGAFSQTPALQDLQALTIDERDIDDLKACRVGDCQIKLSGSMIDQFQTDIDWNATNYQAQASQLFKQMLVEYVRDYLARGDQALMRYADKSQPVGLAEGYRELIMASRYDELTRLQAASAKSPFELTESGIVWSKMKFGLKPVININQVSIYKDVQNPVSQVLIVSKQIYANHYFDASVGLTAYLTIPGDVPRSYLFYENRSLIDGLEGPFGKIKRGVVEDRALAILNSILNQSQVSLNGRTSSVSESSVDLMAIQTQSAWRLRLWHLLVMPLWIALVVLFKRVRTYAGKHLKVKQETRAPDLR